jgi:hypothetical protein
MNTATQPPDTENVALSDDIIPAGTLVHVKAREKDCVLVSCERPKPGGGTQVWVCRVSHEFADRQLRAADPKHQRKFSQRVLRLEADLGAWVANAP